MRRLYLELKNQRFYCFVPPFILFILLPLAVKSGGNRFPLFCILSQQFIPAFAFWWPLFILKEYLNSAGKELLFVYKSGKSSLLLKMIILWTFYALHVTIVFVYFFFLFDNVWSWFVAIIVLSLFMIALAYFLSLLFQNTFIPIIINFAYSIFFSMVLIQSPLSIFEVELGGTSKSAAVAAIASILFLGGCQIEKRLYKKSIS